MPARAAKLFLNWTMECPVLPKHRLKKYSYNEICCLVLLLMMSDGEQAVTRCEIKERGEVTGLEKGQQNMPP